MHCPVLAVREYGVDRQMSLQAGVFDSKRKAAPTNLGQDPKKNSAKIFGERYKHGGQAGGGDNEFRLEP